MDYSQVLSRAWQIIWKHKVLWLFGILAGCAGGRGGGNFNYRMDQDYTKPIQHTFENVSGSTLILLVVGAMVLVFVLILLSIFFGTIGKIGGIKGTLHADQDFENPLKFGQLFRESLPYFWRVFLLGLLVLFAVILAFVVGAILAVLLTAMTLGLFLLVLIPLLCLLLPIGIAFGVIVEQATLAIVTEDLGVIDGLKRGWEVVKTNPGPMAIMWVILGFGIGGLGNLILGLPIIAAMIPLFIMLVQGTDFADSRLWIISVVCFAAYLPFLIALSGILNGYVQSGWTLTFQRLTKPGGSLPEIVEEPLPEPAS